MAECPCCGMNKKLGWRLYECLKNYYKYHLPLDEDVEDSPAELMDEVYDYFKLGEE